MTIRTEEIVLDTNMWIFGIRQTPAYPACAQLLDRLGELSVVIPRQILRELQANLSEEELRAFFAVANRHPQQIRMDWQQVPVELIRKYQALGCKRGDAVVAAHVEHLGVSVLISENRELLTEVSVLPFRILSASATLTEMGEAHRSERA